MFKCQKNKFWLKNPLNLLCGMNIIPLNNMNISEQMNSITKFVILVYFVLLLSNFKYSLLFLLISLLLIIILYYIQRNQMQNLNTEHYTGAQNLHGLPRPRRMNTSLTETPLTKIWCNDSVQLDGPKGAFNNPEYISINQKLAGPANPKTLIAPVVAPPITDLSYWRTNNMVTHSAINTETEIDISQSGYMVEQPCLSYENDINPTFQKYYSSSENYEQPALIRDNGYNQENYEQPALIRDNGYNQENYEQPALIRDNGYNQENYEQPIIVRDNGYNQENYEQPALIRDNGYNQENYEQPAIRDNGYNQENYEQPILIRPNEPGWVNTSCGYNPEQLETAGLPTNLPAGNCSQDPVMKQYNQNLFTDIVQPGVYTTNQIIEPINSNIGISFQQQFSTSDL